MKTWGVGIVGAGVVGMAHANALRGLDGVRLVAVAEPRQEAGRDLASAHHAAWHADLEELLARPDVDVVALCTPSGLHATQAELAARVGKHVVAEKPLAIDLAGADRMIAACRAAGVTLSVIFQARFNRDALRLKRAVDAGLFGRLVSANAVVWLRRDQAYFRANGGWRGTWALNGGGVLINQSIHTIDLLHWFLGPVTSVTGTLATLAHDIETEDTAAAVLCFASGTLATLVATTAAAEEQPPTVTLVGTAGMATLAGGRLLTWRPARTEEVLAAHDLTMTEVSPPDAPWWSAHRTQYRAIFAALREGREPPVPGVEARRALETVLAIYQAARAGTHVTPSRQE